MHPLTFALVVLLRSAPRDELHALRNNIRTRVLDQKVNVVGRDHIIEHAKTEAFLGIVNSVQIGDCPSPVRPGSEGPHVLFQLVNNVPELPRLELTPMYGVLLVCNSCWARYTDLT